MNSFIIHNDLIQNCLSDLWTLYLTFIGVLLSILTLLYSFILGKKDELKLISEHIKLNGSGPIINQKKNFATSYIRRLVKINRHCFALLIVAIFINILCWIGHRLPFNENITFWLFIVVICLTIIVCGYVIFIGFKLIKQYISDTKI